jgi:threonine dehydrogenase-like Zn-dependent dehydrogenase
MTTRRPGGKRREARALWYAKPGVAELREAALPVPGPGEVLVRTQFSGISRGTERLVFEGAVGESEWERMRGPAMEGAFPFPVKYGYGAAGIVEEGPAGWRGRTVFCLHPHQDRFVVPVDAARPVPAGVPARRATLAANMETALNAVWDAGAGPGDRILVVGAGILGLLVTAIAARLPGAAVTTVDVAANRRPLVKALGAEFARPERAPQDADVVFHASASAAGLRTAIAAAGFEARIVEMSWYGAREIAIELGGAFHSRRLELVASQVGHVAASRRARWDRTRRLDMALGLLACESLDALVADAIAFADAPAALPRILARDAQGLAPVIRYDGA